jgi:photosystem II stability/assembly factor-like uncharacterized protein
MSRSTDLLRLLSFAAALGALVPSVSMAQAPIRTSDMTDFHPRSIGPAVTGGRIHDIEAVPSDPSTIYVAAATGGLWKTTNRGQTWVNVFDTMAVSTFGDVALAPSDPEVVYAGTGEQNNRQSTSYGNGVYRSDDGGKSWRFLGLAETRHIGKVEIHPTNPDIAYVAALGNLWASNPERGVFRTRDGGKSWDKILYVDDNTGAVDLVMDPTDPDVLYAAMYQRQRRAWGFNGGGPGSGIYKTTDGGDHWTELTGGIPGDDKGRIGLAISRSDPGVVMALIEYADRNKQGTYRSEDGGASWTRVSDLDSRPMYYSEIFIDPTDPNTVYALATDSKVSHDGGRTWSAFASTPTYDVGVHQDAHALWIDPNDPKHAYLGNDGGFWESYDQGRSFRKINNIVVAQFYSVAADMRDPYWVYGGLQDDHSFAGPSRTRRWAGILNDDWLEVGFSDGTYWQVDPRDSRYAYGSADEGRYFRVDHVTGDNLPISPRPPTGEQYRFDWTSPSMLSAHDPDVFYVAGNRLFISHDRGESWTRTEDLSRQVDRDTLSIMGVKGADIAVSKNDGTTTYGEATTLDESPLDPAVLWVGFDDGNLQVSRDGGTTWTEVSHNVRGIHDGTYVSRITASARGAGVAYAAFDGHRDGDFTPHLYRTEDFGVTWKPLQEGLPELGPVNDVIEHPDNADVIFVGTEHAVFVSTDAGADWAKVPNLPTTLYDDLLIHPREKDLVMGTHGRGIWILDDTRPIAEWASAQGAAYLFTVPRGTIMQYKKDTSYRGQADFLGQNPPDGVEITYRLGPGSGDATLHIEGDRDNVVRDMEVPSEAGTHRVNWDLRHALPGQADVWTRWDDPELARPVAMRGPFVSPGRYTITLQARGTKSTRTIEVRGDPEMSVTVAEYRTRERFLMDLLSLNQKVAATMRDMGISGGGGRGGFGRPSGPPNTPAARLRAVQRTVMSVYGELNGSQVQPGSLFPPTQTQRDAVAAAKRELEAVKAGGG